MEGHNQQVSANTLFRFTRAHKMSLLPSYQQFKGHHRHLFSPEQIQKIKTVYQHGPCGKNSFGHTVIVDRVGHLKLQSLLKIIEYDEIANYTYQRLIALAEEELGQEEQIVWVIDLAGKIMQLGSKKVIDVLTAIITTANKYFPLLLHKLVFVNTPMLFDTIWAKISPLIDKPTQEKIIMLGQQFQQLYEYAPARILPEFLGGDVPEQSWLWGEEKEEESSQEEQVDFSQLKMALGGLKFSGNSLKSVSQTPLNTEADDK